MVWIKKKNSKSGAVCLSIWKICLSSEREGKKREKHGSRAEWITNNPASLPSAIEKTPCFPLLSFGSGKYMKLP